MGAWYLWRKRLVFWPFLCGFWSDLATNLKSYSISASPFPIPLPSFIQIHPVFDDIRKCPPDSSQYQCEAKTREKTADMPMCELCMHIWASKRQTCIHTSESAAALARQKLVRQEPTLADAGNILNTKPSTIQSTSCRSVSNCQLSTGVFTVRQHSLLCRALY